MCFATPKGIEAWHTYRSLYWDVSGTNSWGMVYSIWLFFFTTRVMLCSQCIQCRTEFKANKSMIWYATVAYNNDDNDSYYQDNDNYACSDGEGNSHTVPGQPFCHRRDSNAGTSNVGPMSGRQCRRRANAGPTPTTIRVGPTTACETGGPGPCVSASNTHIDH